jgi:GNAT superfamily N-acetyltransferase
MDLSKRKKKPMPPILYCIANAKIHFSDAKNIIQQYADSLGFNLDFQQFDEEVNDLPSMYSAPNGAIILAYENETAVGCIALRKWNDTTAEIKRMYVLPSHRGKGVGKTLLETIEETAKTLGYRRLLLDTLSTMTTALHIYKNQGWSETTAYRFNPFDGAVFMEKWVESKRFST